MLHFGCWAHVRRKLYGRLEAGCAGCEQRGGGGGHRKALRAGACGPGGRTDALGAEGAATQGVSGALGVARGVLTQSGAGALPKSALGRACSYALKQWVRLERYAAVGNGMVEVDNNRPENAHVRKNWMQIGSEESGPKVAPILSVLATCKRLGVKARDLLFEVLPRLSYRRS